MIKWIDFIKSEQDQIPPTPVLYSEVWMLVWFTVFGGVFRWQPLHCTTSSQQSVHVFRSDQPGQEIKENTTFTFDIQHCLTCAHDYATLCSNIFKQLKHFNFETKTNELTECWWSICHVMTKYLSVRHTIFLPLQTCSLGTNYDQLSFDLYLLQ